MILEIIYNGKVKSVNHTYQFNRKTGSMYMVKDVKDFKNDLTNCCIKAIQQHDKFYATQFPIKSNVDLYLIVIYYHINNKYCDTSNIIKAVQDAMEKDYKKNKIVYENDKQIVDVFLHREKQTWEGLRILLFNNKEEFYKRIQNIEYPF